MKHFKTYEDWSSPLSRPYHQEPKPNSRKIKELFSQTMTDNFIGYSRIDGYPMFECNIEFHRNYHVWKDYFDFEYMKETDNGDVNFSKCVKVTDCSEKKIIKILREKKLIRILFED